MPAHLPAPPCLQEIKAARLQHKLLHKSVAELQRNASAHYAELGADLASMAARLALLPAEAQMTEEQLAVRVDALVKAHLLHVSGQMMALQAALASSGEAGGRAHWQAAGLAGGWILKQVHPGAAVCWLSRLPSRWPR